jgi:succinyl-diaminopimelate desuccinylase
MSNSNTIELLQQLIQRPSVTPDDHGCQQLLAARLEACGFTIENMRFNDVDNLWARRGTQGPLFVFAGHTDVVPTGEESEWTHPPFSGHIADGYIYGRGAADMKGSVAAMVTAAERFFNDASNPDANQLGSMAFLLTSDEEGPAIDGTKRVVEALDARSEVIDFCVVGEPTSKDVLGDIIKNGRRGSLGARLKIIGTQGHVAYPHLADNPVHRCLAMLDELVAIRWDEGDEHFPATTLQISNMNAGNGASNVIPGECIIDFNLRYSPATTVEHIQNTVMSLLSKHQLKSTIEWKDSAQPFITATGSLTDAMREAVQAITGENAKLDTGGGTSDGRFIAKSCKQVIEFGPLNATIHKTDERINCRDIDSLSSIYEKLLGLLLSAQGT